MKHRSVLIALAVMAMASISLGRPVNVGALETGPDLTLSCPSTVVQGDTFDCIAGWGSFTPGNEPFGYQIVVVYDSPFVESGTPSGSGTAMTINSIVREYSAAAMWVGGLEFCPANILNAASALLPTGYVYAYAACVDVSGLSGALLSSQALLRFGFSANGVGTFPVHMLTFSQGGYPLGSLTIDETSTEQTNMYTCSGVTCAASALSTADNPADPMITILPGTSGAITGHVYHDSNAPANALSGVVVRACPAIGPCRSAYTNNSGAYSMLNLADGLYDVSTLDRNPYLSASIGAVSVSGGGTTSGHDIVMVAPPGAISGHVYLNAPGPGNELAGATVGACAAGGSCRTALSAPDGSYSIINLSDGAYDVTAVDPASNVQATITSIVVAGTPTGGHDIVVVLPTGSISGHVYLDSNAPGNALPNAYVWACGPVCHSTTTDGAGAYTISALPDGAYTVRTSAPAPGGYFPATLSGVPVTGGGPTPGQDLVVMQPLPISESPGTTVNGISSGVPGVRQNDPLTVTKVGCPGGTASYSIAGNNGVTVVSGSMPEAPAGTYEASSIMIPPGTLAPLTITITLDCGSGPASNSFNAVYIDPSGFVKTVDGTPIVGATVKLFRSDSPFGPFVQVPNNSAIMSPQNRTNPDTTDVTGHFGWDVIAGYYQVRASMPGCVAAADPSVQVVTWRSYAETAVLEIPPPVFDIDLRLDCDDADNDGYTNKLEEIIGGDSTTFCKIMRADLDDDGVISILDLSKAASVYGQSVPAAPARYDQDSDNVISILDLSKQASVYGKNVTQCV